MGVRNREGVELSYRPARLHRLAESIPGLLKSLKIPPLYSFLNTCLTPCFSYLKCPLVTSSTAWPVWDEPNRTLKLLIT
jgi:hypothetical protein